MSKVLFFKKLLLSSFVLLLVSSTINCSSSKKSDALITGDDKISILGKWVISDHKTIGSFNGDGENLKNLRLFGPKDWMNSEGKYFHFTDSSTCYTNLRMIDEEPIKFIYSYDDSAENISFQLSQDTSLSFVTNIILSQENLILVIDSLLEVTLKKDER